MAYGFFAYVGRLKHIRRWSLMRCAVEENVAEHSLQTAMIAHSLAVIANKFYGGELDCGRIAAIALYHDASEVITGDLPTPIKYYNPNIKESYKAIEAIADEKLLSMLPDALQEDYRRLFSPDCAETELVKCADKISAYLKCLEEKQSGNAEFNTAAQNTLALLEAMYDRHPEVKYFMDNFAQSFTLTLDELK